MTYSLKFTSLDREQQKSALIDFFKNTSEFSNFNFTSSGMGALIDALSYNTYHQSLMANMLYNECFLSTATKRSSVISRANELGYTPNSMRASKAGLNVTVTNVTGSPTSLVLPAGTTFTTTVNNSSFSFVTLVPYATNVQYDTQNVPYYPFVIDVHEGLISQNTTTISSTPLVVLPNIAMDSSTLRVFVTLDTTEYEFYSPTNFLTITPNNKVYFVVEMSSGFKITFGDNTFGLQPPTGSAVRCFYLLTSGAASNGAATFGITSTIPGATGATINVTTISAATGGADAESIESIKTNAVNYFATQDRAVTSNDYKSLIMKASANVKDVLTWGGEVNTPPMFGKIVACIRPLHGDTLSSSDKSNIQTILSSKSVRPDSIVFIDPTYINLIVNSTVTYDSKVITQSTYDLQTLISNTVSNFVDTNLSKFNGVLRISNLSSAIDRTDPSILSNTTTILLKYEYLPTLYQTTSVSFSYNNALDTSNKNYVIKSTLFYISGQTAGVWLEDDGQGNLNLFYSKNGVKTYAAYNVGSINYQTGAVYISSIQITGVDGVTVDFIATPSNEDLYSVNQTIININSNDVLIITQPGK